MMTQANSFAYIVLAFSLGVCLGISILLLVSRARGEQLQRKLAEGSVRVTDAQGTALGASELTGLIAASLPTAGSGVSAARLMLFAAGAAVVAAAVVLLV
jgi:hypothetical protein